MIKNWKDLIANWPAPTDRDGNDLTSPGIAAFAAAIGAQYTAAQVMRHRNRVHSKYWLRVVEAAQATEGLEWLTLEELHKLKSGRPGRRQHGGPRFRGQKVAA